MHRGNALKGFNSGTNFESGAFDHSAISPLMGNYNAINELP
jgi:hypothetical protein